MHRASANWRKKKTKFNINNYSIIICLRARCCLEFHIRMHMNIKIFAICDLFVRCPLAGWPTPATLIYAPLAAEASQLERRKKIGRIQILPKQHMHNTRSKVQAKATFSTAENKKKKKITKINWQIYALELQYYALQAQKGWRTWAASSKQQPTTKCSCRDVKKSW